jgi:superkiller protein 8
MSPDGKFLAATTQDGRVNVYDTTKINEDVKAAQTLAQFETKGSFGTCVDIVSPTRTTDSLQYHANVL